MSASKSEIQEFLTLDGVMQAPGDSREFEGGGWQRPSMTGMNGLADRMNSMPKSSLLTGPL
ncbi:MAG: hypothetical protein A2201_11830 [Alicyclobacillus sp. RIFOXYA1_FULL_53_8]|nr:MAG: hypothetical protein A2201_11830 [Alicyclobacillus sp. RIFOXYA1_FULL_53_8]